MSGLSRREFTESVMTAALVPLLGTGVAPLPAGWWQAAAGPAGALLDGDLDGQARALAGVIRAQYGERLNEADLTAITHVSVETAPTRAWIVPTIDGDCSSATVVASTTCPIGTVTLTCPSSYPGAEMVSR